MEWLASKLKILLVKGCSPPPKPAPLDIENVPELVALLKSACLTIEPMILGNPAEIAFPALLLHVHRAYPSLICFHLPPKKFEGDILLIEIYILPIGYTNSNNFSFLIYLSLSNS